MRSRSVSIGVVVALGAMAAGTARAQSPVDPGARFPVELEASRPDVSIQVFSGPINLPCGQRCVLELPPGQYRVVATRSDGLRSAQFLDLREPSRVIVTPHNQTARMAGYVLMPAGAGTLGVGVLLLWWAGFKAILLSLDGCTGACFTKETAPWIWPGGAIIAGAGAAVGLTGVILWKANAHARLDVTPLGRGPAGAARLRLQPAAGLRWAGLALTGSF